MNIPINFNPIFKKEFTKQEQYYIDRFESINNDIAIYSLQNKSISKIKSIFKAKIFSTKSLTKSEWNMICDLFDTHKKNGNLEYIRELVSYTEMKNKQYQYYFVLNFRADKLFIKSVHSKGYIDSLDNTRI